MTSSSPNNRSLKRASVAHIPSAKPSASEKTTRNRASSMPVNPTTNQSAEKSPSRPSTLKLPSATLAKTTPFTPATVTKHHPQIIFTHLRRTTKSKPISRELKQVFLTAEEADIKEQCLRDYLRKRCIRKDFPIERLDIDTASLRDVLRYTSLYSTGISPDKTEDVPIIVWKCIECIMERTSPDALGVDAHLYLLEKEESPRITELREIFSTGPSFGADHNMDDEQLSDVWILLRTFMDGIAGVKHIKITSVTDKYGLKPTARYMRKRQAKADALAGKTEESIDPEDPIFSPQVIVDRIDDFCISSTVDFTRRTESMVVETAQCYLRLLSLPRLALFRFITAFGTKVYSAVGKANKDDLKPLDDVAHVIAAWFFASPKRTIETTDNLMRFFFKNWKKVDKYLYSMAFDSKSLTNKRAKLQPVLQAPLWNPQEKFSEVETSPHFRNSRTYYDEQPQYEMAPASYYEEERTAYYEDEDDSYHEHENEESFPLSEELPRRYGSGGFRPASEAYDLPRPATSKSRAQLDQDRRYSDALAYIRELEEEREFLLNDRERYAEAVDDLLLRVSN